MGFAPAGTAPGPLGVPRADSAARAGALWPTCPFPPSTRGGPAEVAVAAAHPPAPVPAARGCMHARSREVRLERPTSRFLAFVRDVRGLVDLHMRDRTRGTCASRTRHARKPKQREDRAARLLLFARQNLGADRRSGHRAPIGEEEGAR